MKKRMTISLFLAFSITLGLAQNTKPINSANQRTWVVLITPKTTKQYLDSIITTWKKDSIILKFSTLDYDSKGKLMKVKGSVEITSKGQHASGTFGPINKLEWLEIKLNDGLSVSIKGN